MRRDEGEQSASGDEEEIPAVAALQNVKAAPEVRSGAALGCCAALLTGQYPEWDSCALGIRRP